MGSRTLAECVALRLPRRPVSEFPEAFVNRTAEQVGEGSNIARRQFRRHLD